MSIETPRRIIDISTPLMEGVPVWPKSPGIAVTWMKRVERGDGANLTRLDTDVHVGTHAEGKLHNFTEGETIDEIPLDVFIGPAFVADLGTSDSVTDAVLAAAAIPESTTRLLFKTKNSGFWKTPQHTFREDFAGLTPDGARWVVEHGVKLVANDYLSIAHYGDGREVHDILLKGGVTIIEGVDLSNASQGEYQLICLPLKLIGREAAPARAILLEDPESRI